MIPSTHKVNETLFDLLAQIQHILGENGIGVYAYGSLALGDFDPTYSDLDLIVVTKNMLSEELFSLLENMHMQFNASLSQWANKVEVAYIPQAALKHPGVNTELYPQIEKGRRLSLEPLEIGWPFQAYTLREHAIILAGPDPREFMEPISLEQLYTAAGAIIKLWLNQAEHDPTWREWIKQRSEQSFVVLTLCRLLYTVAMGKVVSKKVAAQWAKEKLPKQLTSLIDNALNDQGKKGSASSHDVEETIHFLHYIAPSFHKATEQ